MTDAFASLGLKRSLSLEEEKIIAAFDARAAGAHPDAGGDSARFGELEAARRTLVEPRLRLRHFLELECPEAATRAPGAIPSTIAAEFAAAGELCARVDGLLARRRVASSSLTRALLGPEQFALRDEVETWLARVQSLTVEANRALETIDRRWREGSPDPAAAAQLQQVFMYLSRWTEQARERLFALSET